MNYISISCGNIIGTKDKQILQCADENVMINKILHGEGERMEVNEFLQKCNDDSLLILSFLLSENRKGETLLLHRECFHDNEKEITPFSAAQCIDGELTNDSLPKKIIENYQELLSRITMNGGVESLQRFRKYLLCLTRSELLYTIHYCDIFHEINVVNDDIVKFHHDCMKNLNGELIDSIETIFYKKTFIPTIVEVFEKNYVEIDPKVGEDYHNPHLARNLHSINVFKESGISEEEYYHSFSSYFSIERDAGPYFLKKVLNDHQFKEFLTIERKYSDSKLTNSFFYLFYKTIHDDKSLLKEFPLEWTFNMCLMEHKNNYPK